MNKESSNYTVYMHINKKNNKKYIGITRQKPELRWQNGNGYKTQPFYKAIQKYGWNGFEHLILYEGLDHKQACKYEKELISEYNTTDKDYGYNCSDGGEDVITYYNCLVHQNKTIYQYSFTGKYLRKFDSIISAVRFLGVENIYADTNISRCAHSKIGTASAFGYMWSFTYEGLHIQSYDLKSKRQTQCMKIYQYNLDGKFIASFKSQTDAASKYNVSSASISSVLDKPCRKCAGFQWRSICYKNGIEKFTTNKNRWNNMRKVIVGIKKNDLSISVYDSVSDAAKELGVTSTTSISSALNKRRPSAYGFFWCYYDEYVNGSWNDRIGYNRMQREVYVYNALCAMELTCDSIKSLCDFFDKNYNIKLSGSCVGNVCNEKTLLYKNLVFSYVKLTSSEILEHYTKKKINKVKKQVYVYDLNCNFINKYDSIVDLSKNSIVDFNIKLNPSQIGEVCNGHQRQYNGFIFSYVKIKEKYSVLPSNHTSSVYIYDLNLNFVIKYNSQAEAERNSKNNIGFTLYQSKISGIYKKGKYGLYNNYIISKRQLFDKNEVSEMVSKHVEIRQVYVYNKNFEYINKYNSVKLLIDNSITDFGTKFNTSNIYEACNGKHNGLYKGYIFSYTPLNENCI